MDSKNYIDYNPTKEALMEFYQKELGRDLTEGDESNIDVLSLHIYHNQFTEEEYNQIFQDPNPQNGVEVASHILMQHYEESKSEWERKYDADRKKEDQIKDEVVYLFLKYFPDDETEERLKRWEKYGRYRNYNQPAMTFADKGGFKYINAEDWFNCATIEQDTIPIMELFSMLTNATEITIKTSGRVRKTILKNRSQRLLKLMIEEWLEERLNPSKSLIRHAQSQEEIESLEALRDSSPNKLDFVWTEEPLRMISKLQEWHNDKICYDEEKHKLRYYYSTWEEIIPWQDTQSITERMIFLYRLGIAFQFDKEDTSLDLTNGDTRKELADKIKYQIKAQREWEIKKGKRVGNSPT